MLVLSSGVAAALQVCSIGAEAVGEASLSEEESTAGVAVVEEEDAGDAFLSEEEAEGAGSFLPLARAEVAPAAEPSAPSAVQRPAGAGIFSSPAALVSARPQPSCYSRCVALAAQ